MQDYRHNSDLKDNLDSNYLGKMIRVKKIKGYIYRGDTHTNLVVSLKPKFYGTYESATEYIKNGNYLKRYTTIKELTLLDISNDNNIENTINFFKNLKYDENELIIKMSIIMLQILFGQIEINTKVDKMGLTDDLISDYFLKNNISNENIKIFLKIINDVIVKDNISPSRCSIRSLDQLLMMNLKILLSSFKIDGIFYVYKMKYNNKTSLCRIVNKYYNGNTCVPSEICIFNPSEVLGGVIIWKKINDNYITISRQNKYSRYIKKNYNRLSLNDLLSITNTKKIL